MADSPHSELLPLNLPMRPLRSSTCTFWAPGPQRATLVRGNPLLAKAPITIRTQPPRPNPPSIQAGPYPVRTKLQRTYDKVWYCSKADSESASGRDRSLE